MLIASPWILLGSAKRQNTVQSNANTTIGRVKSVIHDKYNNCSRFCSVADFFQNGSAWTLEWVGYCWLSILPSLAPDLHIYQHGSKRHEHVNRQTIFLLLISFYSPLLYPRCLKFPIISDDVSERYRCCSNVTDAAIRFASVHLKIVKFHTP